MDDIKYIEFYKESQKLQSKPEIMDAINQQITLSKETKILMDKRYNIEDQLLELYSQIPINGFDESIFGDQELPEHERLQKLMELWYLDDERVKKNLDKINASGLKEKIAKLEQEYEETLFKFYISLLKLDNAINNSREKLFSVEYKQKMKEYADQGVLLYFLETPDVPILSKNISSEDVLESLKYGNYMSLVTLFDGFINIVDPSPSMKRKSEDIKGAITCLVNGEYRSSARTMFALLESEHKNCSSAMDNFFTLDEKLRKGKQRAERIQNILDGLKTHQYFKNVWDIINPIYRDILNSKSSSFIDRNSIIHGDYYDDKMDITENDVIKLMLLFSNMRMISDHIQNYCDMLKETIKYSEIFATQQLKKEKK